MDFESAQTTEKQAGRIETRQITVSSLMTDYLDWPYLGQVFKLERRFTTWLREKWKLRSSMA